VQSGTLFEVGDVGVNTSIQQVLKSVDLAFEGGLKEHGLHFTHLLGAELATFAVQEPKTREEEEEQTK
jgi:hypothetical protein